MRKIVLLASPLLALIATAHCGGDGNDENGKGVGGDNVCPIASQPSENPCTIDERFAVFVKSSQVGDAGATTVEDAGPVSIGAGTRANPHTSITAGLLQAKTEQKRVYVCAGIFREHVTFLDGVSIYGDFSCDDGKWAASPASRARIVAGETPTATAANVVRATRVEGFEIIAEDATTAGGSSVAFVALNSSGLTFFNDAISAGSGKNGVDGIDAVQLANDATLDTTSTYDVGTPLIDGGDGLPGEDWIPKGVLGQPGVYGCSAPTGSTVVAHALAKNKCANAPAGKIFQGGEGGKGGLGAVFVDDDPAGTPYRVFRAATSATPAATTATTAGTGLAGPSGVVGSDGASGTLGIVSEAGFTPGNGTAATDGTSGLGGGGSVGGSVYSTIPPASKCFSVYTGGSGGAGGCPGLAGTPGTGGGASIAMIAIDSAFTLDATTLTSSAAGNGGKGGFGSFGTMGGKGGSGGSTNFPVPTVLSGSGAPGGRGGNGGSGGNGSGGISVAMAFRGTKPTILSTSTLTPGAGGGGVSLRTKANPLAPAESLTIAASPNGTSAADLAL